MHATDTGISLAGLDLGHTHSAEEVLDGVAAYALSLPADAVVLGHGWDESTWANQALPSAAQLDVAAAGRRVYLSQASVHSALVSTALLHAADPSLTGYDESGWLRRDAHHRVRDIAMSSITPAQREHAQQTALSRAAMLGIVAVHECGGPGTSTEDDFTAVLALGGAHHGNPEVYGFWGELMGAEKAIGLGAVGAGGDLYADGALGSRTAHVREPYLDAPGSGHGYVTAEQAAAHLVDCTRHGIQGGFHAIGDEAIATVLEGFRAAEAVLGSDTLRAARHRIEHVEIVDEEIIVGLAQLGVVASMQPAFDRLWGGAGQMYEQRLGLARSMASNPMGAFHAAGVALAFGSDSPVTPLDPWGSVRAAMYHHNQIYRMSGPDAFGAHTVGGWRAVRRDDEGRLRPGAPATFAVWSTPAGLAPYGLPLLEPDSPLPQCHLTVLRGHTLHESAV
jgi:predicted amidohydrolase YtcJ